MTLDAEALADALLALRPDAEPMDLPPEELEALVAEVGGDPADHVLVGRVLIAWERLLG